MTPDEILERVAELFGVTVAELRGPGRAPELAQARFAAAYTLHRRCEAITLRAIGAALGGRNHSTILYALRRAEQLAQRDPDYRARLQSLLDEPSAPMAHHTPAPIALLGRPWSLCPNHKKRTPLSWGGVPRRGDRRLSAAEEAPGCRFTASDYQIPSFVVDFPYQLQPLGIVPTEPACRIPLPSYGSMPPHEKDRLQRADCGTVVRKSPGL